MENFTDPIARLLGAWSAGLTPGAIVFRAALSFAFAAVIGWERSHKRHSAGLRTFILVAIAGTGATLADLYFRAVLGQSAAVVSAAAVVGIAIVSANSLLYSSKSQIRGLTTAAALWASGFIGIASGGGFYTAALVLFVAVMLALSALPPLETALKDHSNHFELHLELKNRGDLQSFIATIRTLGLKIDDIEANPAYLNSGLSVYSVAVTITGAELKKYKQHGEIIAALRTLPYVSYIEEII